jgi:hypothetical protein
MYRSESPPKKLTNGDNSNNWLTKDWASTAKSSSKVPSTKEYVLNY